MAIRGRHLSVVATVAFAALFAVGCGGDDDGESDGAADVADVAALLPEDSDNVSAVDLDGLRSDLGLPADADPAEPPSSKEEATPELQTFLIASGQALPYVQERLAQFVDPETDPLLSSIDHGAVSAAASAIGPEGQVAVIQTSQSFDEIAAGFEEAGTHTVDGSVLAPKKDLPFVGDAGSGRVILASERKVVDAAVADETTTAGPAALIGETPGSLRVAADLSGGDSCLEMFAGGESPGSGEGTLLIVPADEPDLASVDQEADAGGVTFGEPVVDGDRIEVPYTVAEDAPAPGIVSIVQQLAPADVYECP